MNVETTPAGELSDLITTTFGNMRYADDVAVFFVNQGITGKRMDSRCCPVATFINRELERFSASAGTRTLSVYNDSGQDVVLTPNALTRFMAAFDNGLYPELQRDDDEDDDYDE